MTKKTLIDSLEKASNLCEKLDKTRGSVIDLTEIKKSTESFKITIPLIGMFSAGKSSLLNSLIGEKTLRVDITPETTIATELHYGKDPYIQLFKENGDSEKYDISKFNTIDSNSYIYQMLFIDNDYLKNNSSVVLVDMPGLGSNLDAHNKAILNYITKGNKYILIVDIENGSLHESHIRFIKEILGYDQKIDILVNKIEKKTQEDAEAVVNYIKKQSSELFGDSVFVGKVSAAKSIIEDLTAIINKIDYDTLTFNHFKPIIRNQYGKIRNGILVYKKALSLDTKEIDQKIIAINNSRKELLVKIEEQKNAVRKTFSSSALESIISKLKTTLNINSGLLASKLKSSSDSFKITVNEIIRPVLVTSLEEIVSTSYDEIITNIESVIASIHADTGVEKNNSSDFLGILNSGEFNIAFKTIAGGLGVLTTIIAPWLELIILFMPELFKFFSSFIEGNQADKIKMKIENEMIPQIISELRPKIKESLNSIQKDMFLDIEKSIENDLKSISESLEQAKIEKEKVIEKSDNEITQITQVINEWNLIINELN